MRLACYWRAILFVLVACGVPSTALMLLSDVPTPALLIDVGFLRKTLGNVDTIPSLQVVVDNSTATTTEDDEEDSSKRNLLIPQPIDDAWRPHQFDTDPRRSLAAPAEILPQLGICYWHAAVVRGRRQDTDGAGFLAALNLPGAAATDAHLVLGLNNHHVGSYYWARSAGAGASMEAPGIDFDSATGHLAWQDAVNGPAACNSNDGKRSEWVNFLRPGDQVQLVPHDTVRAIHAYYYGCQSRNDDCNKNNKIYGVSSFQRPMGSEPAVVCEWTLEELKF